MNKQSEAKAKQNYQSKPLSRRCRKCKHLIVEEVSNPRGWKEVLTAYENPTKSKEIG